MKVVILAGGMGTRLNEETDRIPKPMVEIGNWPILWHIMKIYGHYGFNDFIICLGYKGYVIKEYFNNYFLHMSDVTLNLQSDTMEVHQKRAEPWRITLIDTGLDTQTGGRLKHIARYLDDGPFCFTYGDGLSDIDIKTLVDFHKTHGKIATVTAIVPPGRFGTLRLDGNKVTNMAEKMDNENTPINGGFFVLDPKALEFISDDRTIWERGPMEALSNNGELMAFHHEGFWQPMDTLRDKILLEELWNSGNAPWKVWE